MNLEVQEIEIACPNIATLAWDKDEVVDVTSGVRASVDGTVSQRTLVMTYRFDRAISLRSGQTFWAIAYTNRDTKAVLMKDGRIVRELNRSFYCAESYDYPITIAKDHSGRVVIAHCPREFNLLEIEDAESGEALLSLKSKHMEFHSRLAMSRDGLFLLDAGWFWHPWCGACVFEIEQSSDPLANGERTVFSSTTEVDAVAFLGKDRLVVSLFPKEEDEAKPNHLRSKQLGVWSLVDQRWESKIDLHEPTGTIKPWKNYLVSFYNHPKLIDLATGRVVHRWEHLYSGKQVGPIDLGDPPPPPIAIDPERGRFAIADSQKITIVCL